MKRLLSTITTIILSITTFTACSPESGQSQEQTSQQATQTQTLTQAQTAGRSYIAIISKGFQHQFWQTVKAGADAAAKQYNVDITFEGPASESDIQQQVDMLNAALTKNPKAICLAALDTESVTSQLNQAKASNIPIVGFDSGVPNAPEGSIVSTASTNNYEAGKLGAQEMFKAPGFENKVKASSAENPVTIAVHSQDATSASILDRTNGFIDEMYKLCESIHAGAVAVSGHDKFKKDTSSPAVIIQVSIPPSTSSTDQQAASQTLLQNSKNLIGYFCSNEASVGGILASTNDGTDLDRTNGKYKDLLVVGFDAGSNQKLAVKNQYFYGSVTQDPYMIGFYAVELACKTINGESVEKIVDTGCKFYTNSNMDQQDIAQLLYD